MFNFYIFDFFLIFSFNEVQNTSFHVYFSAKNPQGVSLGPYFTNEGPQKYTQVRRRV